MRLSAKLTLAAVSLLPASAVGAFLLNAPADVIADCGPMQCVLNGLCTDPGGCVPSPCPPVMAQQCQTGNSWSGCGCTGGGGS